MSRHIKALVRTYYECQGNNETWNHGFSTGIMVALHNAIYYEYVYGGKLTSIEQDRMLFLLIGKVL